MKTVNICKMLLITLFAAFLVGCTPGIDGLTDQQIQERLLEANGNVKSYHLDMGIDAKATMLLFNQTMNISSASVLQGNIDRENKRMGMHGQVRADVTGMKTEMDMDFYIADGMLYTKVMNFWTKTSVPDDTWTAKDQVAQLAELMRNGTIERMPDATEGTEAYYVFTLKPDLKTLAEFALQQQNEDLLQNDINFEDMIKSYDVQLWVNKDTLVIERSNTHLLLVIAGNDSASMSMDMTMTARMSDINKPVTITVPAEAGSAREGKSTNTVTGNAIASLIE